MSKVLTRLEIEEVARRHFGDLGETYVAVATAIALAESGGDVEQVGDNYPRWQTEDSPARFDYGLMQINSQHPYDAWKLWHDADYNMAAAREIYNWQGWGAWTTWRWGLAQPFIQPTTVVQAQSDAQAAVPDAPAAPEPAPSPTSLDLSTMPFAEFDDTQRDRFLMMIWQRLYKYSNEMMVYSAGKANGQRTLIVTYPEP